MVHGKDPAEVEELVAGGEDLMDNLVTISSSLKVILQRVEAGEGLIGELTKHTRGRRAVQRDRPQPRSAELRTILQRIESGEGLLGRLLTDDDMADDLYATAHTLRLTGATMTRDLERSDTAYAALFRDPETAQALCATP